MRKCRIRELKRLMSSGIASFAPWLAEMSRVRSVEHYLAPERRSFIAAESDFCITPESVKETRLFISWKDLKRFDIPAGPKLFPDISISVSFNKGFCFTASRIIVALLSPRLQFVAFILLSEVFLDKNS